MKSESDKTTEGSKTLLTTRPITGQKGSWVVWHVVDRLKRRRPSHFLKRRADHISLKSPYLQKRLRRWGNKGAKRKHLSSL